MKGGNPSVSLMMERGDGQGREWSRRCIDHVAAAYMIRQQREMYEMIENRLDAKTTSMLKETILSRALHKTN